MRSFGFIGFLLLAASCSSDAGTTPTTETDSLPAVDCSKETVPTFSEVTVFNKTCVTCHSSDKTGDARKGRGMEAAPDDINFDSYAEAKASAMAAASELYEGERGAMPPEDSGLPAATDAEKHEALVWAKCGTPQ